MMRIYRLATATALALAASLALAQQEPPPPPPPPGPPVPAQPQGDIAASPLPAPIQQRLEEMQAFMEKMNQTTDPAERQKLVQEHREKMQELTAMMRNLRGGGPMGGMHGMMGGGQGPMGGGHGMMGGEHDKAGGMSCMMGEAHHHHKMMMGLMAAYRQMDKRLDLMQHLLEKMLEENHD